MKETVRIITPGNCDYFRKVVIPAALGDDTGEAAPKNGAYRNALVEYEENGALYIYSSDGIYTKISVESGEYIAGNGINISDGVISANVQRVYLKSSNTVPAGGDTPNEWTKLLPAGMYVIDYYRSVLTDQPSVAGVMVVYHTGNTSTDGKIYHWFYSSDGYVYRREGANQDTTWRLDWSAAPKIDDSFISTRMIAGNAVTTDKVRRPSSGQWYASIPVIGNDGVTEVGKYLDFHDTGDGTSDYDTRLISDDGKLYIGSTSANSRIAKIGDIPTYTAGDNVSITNGVISATDTTYTAGDNVSIADGVISATDTTYTAGTGISISNGAISATRNDLAALLTSQGLDPNPSSSFSEQSITQQQYTAIYNFIDAHRNDGTMYYHGQTGGQSQGGTSSGLPAMTFDTDVFNISEYSLEFEEDKGLGIGTVNFTTVGSMIMIIDGVLAWFLTIAHNIDTDDCFYTNIATGGL